MQVADLRRDGRPAGQRLAGQILAPRGERLLRLALELGRRLLQLGDLQLDAPAAGGHVRHPAAHLCQQLQLPLVGVIKQLAGVLGAVVRLVRLPARSEVLTQSLWYGLPFSQARKGRYEDCDLV